MQYDDYDDDLDYGGGPAGHLSADDYYDLDTDLHSDPPPPSFTLAEHLTGCAVPTTSHFVDMLATHLLTNLLFAGLRLTMARTMRFGPASDLQQLLAIAFGSFVLHYTYGLDGLTRMCAAAVLALLLFEAFAWLRVRRLGFCMAAASVALLLAGELVEPDARLWHRMRGSLLIVAMKVVSVAFELEWGQAAGTKAAQLGAAGADARRPNTLLMAGYLMSPATCVFGPWTPFVEHVNAVHAHWRSWLCWTTAAHILANAIVSYSCLVASNCLVGPLLISDRAPAALVAYRDAMSFRFSHYFVGFLGQTLLLAAGTTPSVQLRGALGTSRAFGLSTTEPWRVEVPRSLGRVVIVWNRPMHYFLKTFVFRAVRPYGTFAAILATYSASAVLHGLNFQLAAVLLSLGFFTYVEHHIRSRLAHIFSACVLAVACPPACGHRNQSTHGWVLLFNVLAAGLAVWNLAYLGQMFVGQTDGDELEPLQDVGYSYGHTLAKWSAMGWSSHVLMAALFLCFKLV